MQRLIMISATFAGDGDLSRPQVPLAGLAVFTNDPDALVKLQDIFSLCIKPPGVSIRVQYAEEEGGK